MPGISETVALGVSFEARSIPDFVRDRIKSPPCPQPSFNDSSDIIIVGGNSQNKGAQAMTFTLVDQLRNRCPDVDIHLFLDPQFETGVESNYSFDVWQWTPDIKAHLYTGGRLFRSKRGVCDEISEVLARADCMFDISGYALSSQWGVDGSISYLMNIMVARAHSVPYAILPQSIGPFNYGPIATVALWPALRTYLQYPYVIHPREDYGVEAVQRYTDTHVSQQFDIVLQNDDYELTNIYGTQPDYDIPEINDESVGIVPNARVFERVNTADIFSLYERIVSMLVDLGYEVYILRHSYEDEDICKEIASRTSSDAVKSVTADLDAVALEELIANMDFLVASRYHSIIHGYKNGVPAVVLGWAQKYQYLLDHFEQEQYFYDGRTRIDREQFLNTVEGMMSNHEKESERITEIREQILERKFFDDFFGRRR